eukprot:COSAG01_NODE_1921_length_8901_cov_18.211770_1_plen_254_part_00
MPPRDFWGVQFGECLGSLGEWPAEPTSCSPRTSSHAATPPGRGAGSPSALSPAPQGLARPSRAAVTPCGPSSLRRRSLLAGVSWESWGRPVTGGKWRARTAGMVCGKAVRVHCGYFHDEAAAGRAAAAEAARQGVKAAREATRQRAEETRRRERGERMALKAAERKEQQEAERLASKEARARERAAKRQTTDRQSQYCKKRLQLKVECVSRLGGLLDGIEEIHSRTTNTSTTRRRITILLMASRVVEVICSFM